MSWAFLVTSLIVVVSPGTGVLYTLSALAFAALKWLGVMYLLYMAWQAWREQGTLSVETRLDAPRSRRVIVTGFLINILNPKLSIFFLAFLPQFIAAGEPHPLTRMLELSATFMAMTFVVFVLYGLFASLVRARVVSRPRVMRWLRRIFAGGFALLGAKLAFAER
jgi:threonine/homoserine/homoserine lactone efflux protein